MRRTGRIVITLSEDVSIQISGYSEKAALRIVAQVAQALKTIGVQS